MNLTGLTVAGHCRAKEQLTGLSIGILNYAKNLNGVQIGILNYCGNNPIPFKLLPLFNVHIGKEHRRYRHND